MSVTVKHLNADSTFLLTFSPEDHPTPSDLKASHGAFTVLFDPWIVGDSIVGQPWFAITKHVVPPCIQHLSELEEPDIVVVSQNKPDHCHENTLRQLRPEGKTHIVAEPGAAKAISKYRHFDPDRVHALRKYNPQERFSMYRHIIPPLSPQGLPGEVTITFVPAKNYMTGLHNAIGVTYKAPTASKALAYVATLELPAQTSPMQKPQQYFPPSPLLIPAPAHRARPSNGSSINFSRPDLNRQSVLSPSPTLPSQLVPPESNGSPTSPPFSPTSTLTANSHTDMSLLHDEHTIRFTSPPTPPESPMSTCTFGSSAPTLNTNVALTPGRPRTVSVIYTPHGIPFKPDLLPYVQNHLIPSGALPLTLMMHSFDHVQNPWYLGGNISTGSRGGVAIAQGLMARCWLSAHDEPKDDRGISVSKLRTSRMTPEEVRRALWQGPDGEWLRKTGWTCDVRSLGVGTEMVIKASRDLIGNSKE